MWTTHSAKFGVFQFEVIFSLCSPSIQPGDRALSTWMCFTGQEHKLPHAPSWHGWYQALPHVGVSSRHTDLPAAGLKFRSLIIFDRLL